MPAETPSQATTFGYLSTLESPEHGYFGGYLIVSGLGRPLEFHCTAPVRPSRAQQILYGSTLKSYLLGEQIGGTLLGASKLIPRLILTDQIATLSIRSRTNVPMAFIIASESNAKKSSVEFCPPTHSDASINFSRDANIDGQLTTRNFTLGNYDVHLPLGHESEQSQIAKLLTTLSEYVDLAEPFGRIHDAIREAQRISGREDEYHGQAA